MVYMWKCVLRMRENSGRGACSVWENVQAEAFGACPHPAAAEELSLSHTHTLVPSTGAHPLTSPLSSSSVSLAGLEVSFGVANSPWGWTTGRKPE